MDAFRNIDDRVSKPVVGSDGAARWQEFHKNSKLPHSGLGGTVAPKAPMKAADRAVGINYWQDERIVENENRKAQGLESLENKQGYTHFKSKGNDKEAKLSAKEKQRILNKIRPDNVEYFIKCETFVEWKWDYVFTTREEYGTGYYWDGSDSVLEMQGQRTRPAAATVTTEEKLKKEATIKSKRKDVHETNETEIRKKKKKKKSINSPSQIEVPSDTNHPLEQVAAALQRQQQGGAEAALLPAGWHAAKDPFSGKTYYYHATTGERSWRLPTTTSTSNTALTPSDWTEIVDKITGKTYYYNSHTQETSWERPLASSAGDAEK